MHHRFSIAALLLAFAASASAQTVTRPITPAGHDGVNLVAFYSGGQIDPKGKNIAVVDADGKAVPYRLMAHDENGQTVIAVDFTGKSNLSLQYGLKSLNATKVDEKIQPSLVMQTFPLTRGGFANPAQVIEYTQGVKAFGTGLVQTIDYAHNPFGPQEKFVTLFEGVIELKEDASFRMFSANDDAAFVEIDGKVIISEPATHIVTDFDRLVRQSIDVKLEKGKHRVRYVHVQLEKQSFAVLGIIKNSPQAAVPLEASHYVHDDWAKLGEAKIESPRPLIGFDAEQIDQVGHGDSTFTRFALRPIAPPAAGMQYRWSFGDGTASLSVKKRASTGDSENDVEHVFAWPVSNNSGPNWKVTLELVDGKGAVAASAASVIRPVFFNSTKTTDEPGVLEAYVKAIGQADYAKADAEAMAALYNLAWEMETPAAVAPITEPFVQRFGDRGGEVVWNMKYALATHVARSDPARAEKLYAELARTAKDSWAGTRAGAEELDLLIFRLNAKPADVQATFGQLFRGRQPRERALLRAKAGDVYRLSGDVAKATEAYEEAAKENARQIDAKKAAVLDRAYRETSFGYLQQKRYPALREELLAWEADFPMAKLGGDLPLLTGRYFQEVGDDPRAVVEYKTILNLNPLHPSKPELIFRLAQSLARTGQAEEAKKLFAQVVKDYPNSPFAADAANANYLIEN